MITWGSFIWVFLLSLLLSGLSPGLSGASIFECADEIILPTHTFLSRSTRQEGVAVVHFTVDRDHKLADLDLITQNKHGALFSQIKELLGLWKFSNRCDGLSFRLTFDFRIAGPKTDFPVQQYRILMPDTFVITATPQATEPSH